MLQSAYSRTAALAFICCLLHEAGHIGAMALFGIKAAALTFYGGGIAMKSSPPAAFTGTAAEICVLLGGCAVNFALYALGSFTGNELFAYTNLALGLFNLLPFSSLDGGRIINTLCGELAPGLDIDGVQSFIDILFGIPIAVFLIFSGNAGFSLPLTMALIIIESLGRRC